MRMTRNWWMGVAAGAVVGLGGVIAAEQATTDANAATFSVTPAQLQINQRISQAAVRRSNESLDLLDPVRTSGAQDDAPGWGTAQIRDGAVTSAKLDTAVREAQPRCRGHDRRRGHHPDHQRRRGRDDGGQLCAARAADGRSEDVLP